MKIEKQIKKAFAMLSRVDETDEAADCARTICRESRALASLPPSLRAFFKTNDCCALLKSLEEVLPDGALPVYADFLSQWQGGLSIRQAANFRMTLLLFLLLKASAAAEKKDTAALKEITRSFFTCKDYCFPELTEKLCDAARILSGEQAGVYANMADETRAEYLRVLALEAKKQGVSEKLLAEKIVQKANREGKHCGFFLPLRKERKKEGIARIVCAYLLSMAVCLSLGIFLQNAAAGLLLFLPVLKMVWSLTSRAAAASGKPAVIFRMDPEKLPKTCGAVAAVSTVLPAASQLEKLEEHLLSLYLSNRNSISALCLLADLSPAAEPEMPSDRTDADACRRMIDRLNGRFGGKFVFCLRPRVYSRTEGEYIGAERKRGAVLALTDYMTTGRNVFSVMYGDISALTASDYVMLLDGDTLLPFDSLRLALAAAYHPLNQPVIDPLTDTVKSGYGIFAPAASPSVRGFSATRFSRDMCRSGGVSSYDRANHDFYSDYFGDGIFCGKGLIHAPTFCRLLQSRFREERMLSHDIAEGLVLRVLSLTDMSVTDDFPKSEASYLKRAHRWIRGDVQNLPLLGRKVWGFGKKVLSPFSFDARYKLFDNIRRAATAAFLPIGIFCALFLHGVPSAAVILICLFAAGFDDWLSGLLALLRGGTRALSGLYKEDAVPEALSAWIRAFLSTAMLASDGFCALDAILRALWRMFVSGRHLLSWVPAASAEQGSIASASRLVPVIGLSVILLLSGRTFAIFSGLLFVFDLVYAKVSNRPLSAGRAKLTARDRVFLERECAAMWRYFPDTRKAEYHFLPPDNISLSPLPETALRTSPTNIGLALCACLAARDLGYLDSKELYSYLNDTVSSVEKLEKWHGNLLNWYDIVTMKPLAPVYASFVDCGNFLCCITALCEGLLEYVAEEPRLSEIVVRLRTLRRESDLSVFYNRNRRLFAIGYDCEKEKRSDSYYDLLMSEARMASFLAVADGFAGREHWAALARTAAKNGRYSGALSWSGTMFEYFMPYLFLPSEKNTLTDESLWFCLKSQMKYAAKHHIPWGISESCIFAFNENMNYHYRANGVPQTALRYFERADLTVAPYAVFLTVPFLPAESCANLRRLEKYPIKGKYGFFEALDFTPGRTCAGQSAPVRCFMVHHVGMSFLAAENALRSMIWQRRFMRDVNTRAAYSLLLERVPTESLFAPPAPKSRQENEKEYRRGKKSTGEAAAVFVASELSAALHRDGSMALRRGNLSVFRDPSSCASPGGLFAAVWDKERAYPFCKATGQADGKFSVRFRAGEAEYTARYNEWRLTATIRFHRQRPCLAITYSIRNLASHEKECALLLYGEPSLAPLAEEKAHRAFSKLFVQSEAAKEQALLFFRSTKRSEGALAIGMKNADFAFTTDREEVLQPNGGMRSLFQRDFLPNGRTGSTDCCFYGRKAFRVGGKKEASFTLYLCVADTRKEALAHFSVLRDRGFLPAENCRLFAAAPQRAAVASSLLSETIFAALPHRKTGDAAEQNDQGVEALWAAGISGDVPIVLFDCGNSGPSGAWDFAVTAAALNARGFRLDLAVLHDSCRPAETARFSRLSGGNVHLLCRAKTDSRTRMLLPAVAAAVYPGSDTRQKQEILPLLAAEAYEPESQTGSVTPDGFQTAIHPPVPWCRTLANRVFGCLVSDRSLGFTWALNAAENKLTPWINDPCSDEGGELLTAEIQGHHYDLIASGTAFLGRTEAKYQSRCGGCVFTIRVMVPQKGMRKRLRVSVRNVSTQNRSGKIAYTLCPLMGRDLSFAGTVRRRVTENGVFFDNPYQKDFTGVLYLHAKQASFLPALLFAKNAAMPDGISAVFSYSVAPSEEWECEWVLSYGVTAQAAEKAAMLSLPEAKLPPLPPITLLPVRSDLLADLYSQTLFTRVFARCGFYQCGGAFGCRDQLQDCLNLLAFEPRLLQQQILRTAACQFPEGDALHWWHGLLPGGKQKRRGVRTRCSDDFLWLPLATAVYVKQTGDWALLQKQIPFAAGDLLRDGEKDRYFTVEASAEQASLWDHCLRALERADTRGAHGLLLIGSGDWNDSFDEIGRGGESVWLTMFYLLCLKHSLPLCQKLGDKQREQAFQSRIRELTEAVEQNAWSGDRYVRAFYPDGNAIGKKGAGACEVDLLPQCFAVLSGLPEREKRKTAMETAWRELYDPEHRLLRLFSPPFTRGSRRTGYVNDYPPGVRENGGQYTHAAVWFLRALLKEGMMREAKELLQALDPMLRLRADGSTGEYQKEPYALCGDVYSLKGYEGRGGWSLYTGAAGWLLSTLYAYGIPGETDPIFSDSALLEDANDDKDQ